MTASVAWVQARTRPLLREKLAITGGLNALFAVFWFLIPRVLVHDATVLPLTSLEQRLPFMESFVYAYLSIALFMPIAPYLTVSRELLWRHAAGFATLSLVAFACFVLYPVAVPVPATPARTLLFQFLLADTRLNSLPSLHAGYTVYSLLYWRHVLPDIPHAAARRTVALVVTGWGCVILLSVLLTKQHYLVDVVAGVALGAAGYWLTFRAASQPTARPFGSPLPYRR